MRRLLTLTAMILLQISLLGQSCDLPVGTYYNYSDIKAILEVNNCDNCHSTTGSASEWLFDTYEQMLAPGECDIPMIVHGNASQSLLYDKLNGGISLCGLPMPLQSVPVSEADLWAIEKWINDGATEECVPFYDEVSTMFELQGCQSCHTSSSSWSTATYQHIVGSLAEADCDIIVKPYSAEQSQLYQMMKAGEYCDEVPGHTTLDASDLLLLRDWINGGALDGFSSLPVQISRFDVALVGEKVELTWVSEQEIGVDVYEVQRSLDAVNYTAIGEVEAVHNSSTRTLYDYQDYDYSLGISYYRLQVKDLDGTTNYTSIVPLRIKVNRDMLDIYPNVITNGQSITAEWYSTLETTSSYAAIVNEAGMVIAEVTLTAGVNNVELPILDSGIYYMIAQDFQGPQQFRVFIVVD